MTERCMWGQLTEVRSKAGTLKRPSGRGYSSATIFALLCMLAVTACSAPQSTSSTWHRPSGQIWTHSVATNGVAIEAADVSGEQVAAAAESDGDPLGTAWAPESTAAKPFLFTPAERAKAPKLDWQSRDKIQLADASGTPVTFTAQNSNESADNAGGTSDLAKMAQKANNPLSDVWLLLVQNDTTVFDGDLLDNRNEDSKVLNSLKIQPVMPVPVFGGDWNLIFRPVIQVVSAPLDSDVGSLAGLNQGQIAADPSLSQIAQDPFGRTNGLGDSVLLTLLGPNRDDGFVWGAGATQIFPTATEDVLGQGKWQAGPAALAVLLGNQSGGLGIENWNIGALAQHWWSYAGESNRAHTNQSNIQYFINWRLNDTQLIGMTPNIQINWNADSGEKLSFPVGLGFIGMFRIGRLPIRWGVEAQYYVISPDAIGPQWNFKVFFAPIILNPFK